MWNQRESLFFVTTELFFKKKTHTHLVIKLKKSTMLKLTLVSVTLILTCFHSLSEAFSPPSHPLFRLKSSSLQMEKGNGSEKIDVRKMIGSSAVAAALFVSSTFGGVEEAMAFTDSSNYNSDFSGSATLIAGRSGGRMGGRSSMRSAPRRSAPTSSYQRRTVVQPGGVMVAPPPVVISPFGYSPFGKKEFFQN